MRRKSNESAFGWCCDAVLQPAEAGGEEGGEHEDGHLAVQDATVVRPDEPEMPCPDRCHTEYPPMAETNEDKQTEDQQAGMVEFAPAYA